MRFDNGEVAQMDHPKYGKRTVVILGWHPDSDGRTYWVVHPKVPLSKTVSPWTCLVIEDSYLVATPF